MRPAPDYVGMRTVAAVVRDSTGSVFANPVEAGGMTRRQWPGTREHLYRLVLSASWLSNLKNGSTEPPKVFRLEIRSGRFLMRQRRCLGSPHPDFASVADSLMPSLNREYGDLHLQWPTNQSAISGGRRGATRAAASASGSAPRRSFSKASVL